MRRSGALFNKVSWSFVWAMPKKEKQKHKKMKVPKVGSAHLVTPMTTESPSSHGPTLISSPNMKGSFLHSHSSLKKKTEEIVQSDPRALADDHLYSSSLPSVHVAKMRGCEI